jgi:hypothetical protein
MPEGPGSEQFSHGLGVGDMNRDGRKDVVTPQGWYESPADPSQAVWTFHSLPLGPDAAQMHVFDFDGDGDQDVLSSSSHNYGIWWHERRPSGAVTHDIFTGFSQTHALEMADLNTDGLPDFVTGKRWFAHAPPGDPGTFEPAVLYWFELRRSGGTPFWIPHEIDRSSGMGTQFQIGDVNGDGRLDIVTANKRGVFLFQQSPSTPISLPGDYNNNGAVDAADYTLWRNNVGAPAGTLPNDINGGVIGPAQYAMWKARFGNTAGSSAASFASVPEPASVLLLLLAAIVAAMQCADSCVKTR